MAYRCIKYPGLECDGCGNCHPDEEEVDEVIEEDEESEEQHDGRTEVQYKENHLLEKSDL